MYENYPVEAYESWSEDSLQACNKCGIMFSEDGGYWLEEKNEEKIFMQSRHSFMPIFFVLKKKDGDSHQEDKADMKGYV